MGSAGKSRSQLWIKVVAEVVERTSRPKTFLRCNTFHLQPESHHRLPVTPQAFFGGGLHPGMAGGQTFMRPQIGSSIRCQWHDLVDVGPVNQTGLALAPSFSLLEVALQSTVALLCEL